MKRIQPPAGTSGLATEAEGQYYAIAANWTDDEAQVLYYQEYKWLPEPSGRRVAQFGHSSLEALAAVLLDSGKSADVANQAVKKAVVIYPADR
jgi:hypothetical protein